MIDLYVNSVLILYADLPDTPFRANTQDQRQARSWFDRGICGILLHCR